MKRSLATVLILILLSAIGMAEQKSFRQEFIEATRAQQFEVLGDLVKKNKDIIPGEIRSLIAEAAADTKFQKRIELLDIAMRMASMYHHWHGGGEGLIKEIGNILAIETARYEKRVAEETKWEKMEERATGNLILKGKIMEMSEKGLAPVVYPHWMHRIWFKCKVCHEEIFIKRKEGNNISQGEILKGKQCGVCHNGTIAFGADKECEKCHIAGKSGAERLFDIRHADHGKIKEVAQRLGAEWNIEKMPGKTIPIDRLNIIDWSKLKEHGVINPIPSLEKGFQEGSRESRVLFETRSTITRDVLFDHRVHSWWLNCSSCHNTLFMDKPGANDIRMIDMSKGKNCGNCHNKVSFSFADCLRCHNQEKGKAPADALIRKPLQ